MNEIKVDPVQMPATRRDGRAVVPQVVTLRAYQVYSQLYGPQEAIVTGDCRGGFEIGELVAFLYAFSFPREEWRSRVDEAFRGMKL